jgi:hypothetical protein
MINTRLNFITSILLSSIITATTPALAAVPYDYNENTAHLLSARMPSAIQEGNNFYFQNEQGKYNIVGVALFSGDDVVSKAIKAVTNSNISHVGLILSDTKDENKWYSFESTGSADEVMKGIFPHVRLTEWDRIIKEYEGTVDYRLFVFDNKDRTAANVVTKYVDLYDHKPYTKNIFKLFGALFKLNKQTQSEVLEDAFCSELTAQILMDLGILNQGVSGNYIPSDFASSAYLPLTSGVSLTPEFKGA